MTMPMQYLILHKVRGEPAFDIAERMTIDGEDMWIIGTSGHRAYPYWWFGPLVIEPTDDGPYISCELHGPIPPMPNDLPDHYPNGDAPAEAIDLVALGLIKPKSPMRRI